MKIKYPLIRPVIDEISGGTEALAHMTGIEEQLLKEKLAGEREITIEEAICISDALNRVFNIKMFTPYVFRIESETISDEKQRCVLNAKRSEATITSEIAICQLKDMRKQLLHYDSLAISHEEYRKKHGEEKARMWADIDYDVLTFAIEAVRKRWYHHCELGENKRI